jgi:NAD+ synthase (glutamine-hydrolysing)
VSFGLPVRLNKATYNASCLVADGQLLGFAAKHALAGDGIHYEPRWFKPWPAGARADLLVGTERYPIGDLFFECGGVRIGFEICEDAWVAQRPGAALALEAVDIIMNPSASHFAFGKHEVRRRLVLESSRAFGVSYIYANLLGNEAGRAIYDGDSMIASAGQMLAQAPRFSFRDGELITATIDVELTRSQHGAVPSHKPHVDNGESVRTPFEFPEADPQRTAARGASWEAAAVKEQEFARAVALGLFDYLRKSRSRGFIVSLSGGADSASVSCLVRLMVRLAVDQLGLDGTIERLRGSVEPVRDEETLMRQILTTAYQSTKNSSEVTRNAARAVAEAVGSRHLELDVDDLVQGYVGAVESALGRKLTWERDDIALQNIQARVRAPSVWLLANLTGSLLLSTSNRSEAAVGYATMDGDTCGGLSPIAGIDKAYLRTWLEWLEREGPSELGPLPALRAVNVQAPTAELRPREAAQTDEDDLMPYPLLDAVERAAIRDKRSPVEVFQLMRVEFPQLEPRQLGLWVERFFRLFARNQWKRERYAPSFHLDDANLDPKTWCRFPILSGGFERELVALRERVERDG